MVQTIFIALFLVLFPFGQIIRLGVAHPVDIVVGLGAVYSIIIKTKRPDAFKYIQNFLLIATFSWVFSVFIFSQIMVLYGLLYLFRLFAYSYFLIYVWNFASNAKNRELLLNSLLSVSIISAVFGWIQFFTVPDLKPFFEWGWDQHLFRLVGTFLDPTFLGLIIVFGLLISMIRFIEVKNKRNCLIIGLFLLISLAFTYSRASYLAFIFGIGYILYTYKKIGYILYPIIVLSALIFFLPTSKNNSINFFRSFSAVARLDNYADTIKVFKSSPVLGVGFNNMCLARQKIIGPESFSSHACSGSDSSLLLILATTGVMGLIVFIHSVYNVLTSSKHSTYYILLTACIVALFVHSLFSNSMFYPWVMGYMAILIAIVLKKKK